ncbi:hypothetical protein BDZ94DRAFT_1305213 [Collybia nuda]|uniref:Uncharacterized protein n=1 Tax=Collybia nuda TaxID=64659 RepID=A0A9P5YET8_9AGAR|nr:hypothetical protein BDZ94DRAFT_1305213 [Collybia nuda]
MSSPGELINAVITTNKGMTNVTEYNFERGDLPLSNDTQSLLEAAGITFETTLTKLVLAELELNFGYVPVNFLGPDEHTAVTLNQKLLAKQLAPFINYMSPSPQPPATSSSVLGSHSQFFYVLSLFLKLQLLVIRIPFDDIHLMNSVATLISLFFGPLFER